MFVLLGLCLTRLRRWNGTTKPVGLASGFVYAGTNKKSAIETHLYMNFESKKHQVIHESFAF